MLLRIPRIRVFGAGVVPASAVLLVLLVGDGRPARAVIDNAGGSLSNQCKLVDAIAVLRVEKVNREKRGIVYRKVRDLKGRFPGPRPYSGETFTHVLRRNPNPDWHREDYHNQDLQNDAILAWAAEGKTAVVFQRGAEQAVCVGHAWYALRGEPPARGRWVLAGGADSRFLRLFCGDAGDLVAALTGLLAGKDATVPRMVGTAKMLSDRSGPVRRARADGVGPQGEFYDPFLGQGPWSTHRGDPRRTGADDRPGPRAAKVLWAYASRDHFIAPLVPGANEVFASSLGGFNTPGFHAFALEPAAEKRLRWAKGAPLLRQPVAGAPALVRGHTEMLVFGDGFHTAEGASLRCLRASDGLPLWELPAPGKLVHFEGTPTFAKGRLYAGGGNAGVLCLDPALVTAEGREQDLVLAQAALQGRRRDLLARYEAEKKKGPEYTPPPDGDALPLPAPKRLWQAGEGRWHVDAPVAVVEGCVLAASAYLGDDKAGECAVVCLQSRDGSAVWKTSLRLNPWAGPTVGPYVLVGCSSIRLDPKAIPGAKGEVLALELDTGAVKWRKGVAGGVLSSVAVREGLAVFTATDGKVRAWDAHTGEERWVYDAKAPFFAGPAVTAKTVYAADLKGVVHAISLADGKGEWLLDLAAGPAADATVMVYGSPTVHGGRLYLATCALGGVRGGPNRVVCIGEK
jgi:outer membrane protein assembly factor BamB